MRTQMSIRFVLFLLLSFFVGSAIGSLANGHGKGAGDCADPSALECDPDFDDPLALIPHNYDFGGVPVGSEAVPVSYALVNGSGAEVQVGNITVSGEGVMTCMAIGCPVIAGSEFYLVSDQCSGVTLADQESCELEMGFLPTQAGDYISGLWVPYTPTGGEAQTIRGKLAGTGYVGDGTGFTLSGAVYLFQPPSAQEIMEHVRQLAGTAPNSRMGGIPGGPLPPVRAWQPVAGVTLTLDNGATAQTDERGEYHFDGVPAGSYMVVPQADGYRFFPQVRQVRINGRDRPGIEFRARALPVATE